MKRFLILCACLLVLSGCASIRSWQAERDAAKAAANAPPPVPPPQFDSDGMPRVMVDGVEVARIEFRAGVSSATVERTAKNAACVGGVGAGLVTPSGPVEVYRMRCDDGRVFLAKCELRQCKPMQ